MTGWPLAAGRAGPPWTIEEVAAWALEHARPEGDESLYVRVGHGGIVDAGLGVVWNPTARRRSGWVGLGQTSWLLRNLPSVRQVAERLRQVMRTEVETQRRSRAS